MNSVDDGNRFAIRRKPDDEEMPMTFLEAVQFLTQFDILQ
jgi:hypothetical protein